MTEDLTREILEQDNRQLREALESVQALLNRPVNVTVSAPPVPEQATLKKVADYLPQLSHISTNLSHVASAVQSVNTTLLAIDSTLKELRHEQRSDPM